MDMKLQSAFLAEISTLLILLAGAILLYRSFREKYLLPWLAGWVTFGFSKLFGSLSGLHPLSSLWLTLANITFALTVGLFCTAVFLYLGQKKLLLPTALTISL